MIRGVVVSLFGVVALVSSANAADFYGSQAGGLKDGPVYGWQTGFYVRGDVGGAFSNSATFRDVDPNSPFSSIGTALVEGHTTSSVLIDGGVGYRFSPYFRTDATLGYAPSVKFKGTSNDPLNPFSFSADTRPLFGLVNGYVDLAGFSPNYFRWVQPFILGGIGFSSNSLSNGFVQGPGFTQTISDNTHTSFAWDVGGGVSIPINSFLTIDLTYRYMDLGEVRTGTNVVDSAFGALPPVTGIKSDLRFNTFTLGARYSW